MRRYLFLLLYCTLLLTVGQPVLAASRLTLPPGFVDELVVDGLFSPRAFVFAPDGRIFIAERGNASSDDQNFASIRVFKNGTLLPTRALELNTCGDSERGFLGLALDPNFANNGYVYIYYTRQATNGAPCAFNTYTYSDATPPNRLIGPRNRISRVTMIGDTIALASEVILIDDIITDVGYHNAGDLHFDSQGYLYATTGDGGLSEAHQNISPDNDTLNGKMLRIKPIDTAVDPRGYVTTGNPYESSLGSRTCGTTSPSADPSISTNNSAPCREVFASGFRNPFRFTIQSGTDTPFVGDVGGGAWEEIDQITPGGNYGYPVREGPCPAGVVCSPPFTPSGLDDPIYAYSHVAINTNVDSAVIGGDFYTGTGNAILDYPSQYMNNYFFADFVRGFIRRLKFDSRTNTWNAQLPEFATGGLGIIGLKTGPDGNLYYLAFVDTDTQMHISQIRRIRWAENENQKPVAKASVNKVNGPLSTVYTFSASGSFDPDHNTPLKYTWDFGDNQSVSTTSTTVTHTYSAAVNATATLTATDYNGSGAVSDPVTLTVYPGNTPATGTLLLTNLTVPTRITTYFAGDTWQFDASGLSDPDGGPAPIPTWSIVFHHSNHTHPFVPLATIAGTFQIPYQNFEPATNVWFRVYLFITDARGQVTTIQRDIHPVTATITLNTSFPGGQVEVDGAIFPSPHVFSRVVGMRTTINTSNTVSVGTTTYPFIRWSDNGLQLHTLVVPSANTTYTAFYSPTTQPVRNYDAGTLVALTWNRVDWATGYEIQIDDDPGFVQPLHTSTLLSADTLTYTAPALPNGLYYWHVRAKKSDGTFGSYGPTESFALVAP
ncbi:MAG: PQQ-dependent sugar dehydrogenase [Chloroflexota bacterium]